jgi:hypothetical protein
MGLNKKNTYLVPEFKHQVTGDSHDFSGIGKRMNIVSCHLHYYKIVWTSDCVK